MLYQSRQRRNRTNNNKSIFTASNNNSEQYFNNQRNSQRQRKKYNHSKTEVSGGYTGDSLQSFQNQLNTILKATSSKKQAKKKSFLPTLHDSSYRETQQIQQIKNQVQVIKNLIQNRQRNIIQDKLDQILVELGTQKQRLRSFSQRQRSRQIDIQKLAQVNQTPAPIYQQPQIMYQPFPYFQPYHSQHYSKRTFRRRRQRQESSQEQSDDQKIKKKGGKKYQNPRRQTENISKYKPKGRSMAKNRLRIIFHAIRFMMRLRKQAKVKAALRREKLQKFCKQNFFQIVNNVKEWLLEAQKIPLSIILQKSKLNLQFSSQQSDRVKTEKKKFILKVVYLGLKSLSETTNAKSIAKFSEVITNLCMDGCYPIRNLWTKHELSLVPISEHYGFFKLDDNLQKFLITLLIFVKIFLFNMFLQPSKFDSINFPKNAQPLKTNMKIISSAYYQIFKKVLSSYMQQPRDKSIYKINMNSTQLSKIVPSQPYVYENGSVKKQEYISGLYQQSQLGGLEQEKQWDVCVGVVEEVVDKIHRIVKQNNK